MKKVLALILATVLIFLLTSNISATPNSDIVYSITDIPPFLYSSISMAGIDYLYPTVTLTYYNRDETAAFVQFDNDSVVLNGSYLSDSGFFLDSIVVKSYSNNYWMLFPGYRFKFNDSNYISFRIIYFDNFASGYSYLELDTFGRYLDKKTKITWELTYGKNRIGVSGAINRLIKDGLVIHGGVNAERVRYLDTYYYLNPNVGFSLNNNYFASNLSLFFPNLIIPFEYYNLSYILPNISANLIGYIGNIGLGADYSITRSDQNWEQQYSLKGKYRFTDSSLVLTFKPANYVWSLSYENML